MPSPIEWTAAAAELCVISFIGWRAARSIRRAKKRIGEGDGDAFTAIRAAAHETVRFHWAAEAVAQEMAMFYYAFFCWRKAPPPEGEGFSSYRNNSYGIFMIAIVIVLVIETVAVHLLIYMLWSKIAAWIFTAISIYTLIWMIGDWQALRLRRTTVSSTAILLKLGTRWEVEIPRDAIHSISVPGEAETGAKSLKMVLLGAPDIEIELSRPLSARGMYGYRRTAENIHLQIDETERFIAQIEAPAFPD